MRKTFKKTSSITPGEYSFLEVFNSTASTCVEDEIGRKIRFPKIQCKKTEELMHTELDRVEKREIRIAWVALGEWKEGSEMSGRGWPRNAIAESEWGNMPP